MYIDGTTDLTFLDRDTVKGSYFCYNSTTGVIFFHAEISVIVAQNYSIGNVNQWGGGAARWTGSAYAFYDAVPTTLVAYIEYGMMNVYIPDELKNKPLRLYVHFSWPIVMARNVPEPW